MPSAEYSVQGSLFLTIQGKGGITEIAAPCHCEADYGTSKSCSHTGAHDTKVRNQQGVKDHIKNTHRSIQDTWSNHIPTALQE